MSETRAGASSSPPRRRHLPVNETPLSFTPTPPSDMTPPSKRKTSQQLMSNTIPPVTLTASTATPWRQLEPESQFTFTQQLRASLPATAQALSSTTTNSSIHKPSVQTGDTIASMTPFTGSTDQLVTPGGTHLNPANNRGVGVRRQRSLVRPERVRHLRHALNTDDMEGVNHSSIEQDEEETPCCPGCDTCCLSTSNRRAFEAAHPRGLCTCWPSFTFLVTCYAPSFVLAQCCGMKDPLKQAAWREKMALCTLIVFLCGVLAYLTFGFTMTVCRPNTSVQLYRDVANSPGKYFLQGVLMEWNPLPAHATLPQLSQTFTSGDVTPWFQGSDACLTSVGTRFPLKCQLGNLPEHCHSVTDAVQQASTGQDVAFEWQDIVGTTRLVYNGRVLDSQMYLEQVPLNSDNLPFGLQVDQALRSLQGNDASRRLALLDPGLVQCVVDSLGVGVLDVRTIGCFATDIVLYTSLVVILAVVLIRFFLAIFFSWFVAKKLSAGSENLSRKGNPTNNSNGQMNPNATNPISNNTIYNHNQQQQSNTNVGRKWSVGPKHSRFSQATFRSNSQSSLPLPMNMFAPKQDSTNSDKMYSMLLVTCYSEGLDGLKTTLDSLALTDYDDEQKLLVVIADGIITGAGNEKSTPDILLDLMEVTTTSEVKPKSYLAIADGSKRHNMARVYSGYYNVTVDNSPDQNRHIPMLLIVKCGTPQEANAAKPGNRGKRDSQMILMSFLAKVLLDDRMTPLEYDLFQKCHALTGHTPDQYELVLMVDADTKVMEDALRLMVQAMRQDPTIMGLCGETRIANKTQSWVTMIQVFEYYISHHLAKSFESMFGGVTCLPGCFCMYRIKAPKGAPGYWVPILASPDIINMYAENVTDTLHKKNLLLLGEDRYLTTLMLKTFPKRKMMFVPEAQCKTQVPDEFRVLLSQRRRWINSTVHNLMELVLVRDLCGTFCCSMQFVVFMELTGTLVLPAAIIFTFVLIISTFVGEPQYIPLALLAAILGLPAVLILFTTRQLVYVGWMLIYLLALPIWNFVLPVYAFSKFDDFSWGATRQLGGAAANQGAGDDHGKREGEFDGSQLMMKRWHEWESDSMQK